VVRLLNNTTGARVIYDVRDRQVLIPPGTTMSVDVDPAKLGRLLRSSGLKLASGHDTPAATREEHVDGNMPEQQRANGIKILLDDVSTDNITVPELNRRARELLGDEHLAKRTPKKQLVELLEARLRASEA
jgi:hypothetical protein